MRKVRRNGPQPPQQRPPPPEGCWSIVGNQMVVSIEFARTCADIRIGCWTTPAAPRRRSPEPGAYGGVSWEERAGTVVVWVVKAAGWPASPPAAAAVLRGC